MFGTLESFHDCEGIIEDNYCLDGTHRGVITLRYSIGEQSLLQDREVKVPESFFHEIGILKAQRLVLGSLQRGIRA